MYPPPAWLGASSVGALCDGVTAVSLDAAAPMQPSVGDQLLAVKHRRTCSITTRGRRTGRPHTVTVWFVVDGEGVDLSTLDGRRGV